MIARAAGAAALVLCVVGLAIWSLPRSTGEREYYFGGIACHDVRVNLQALAMGTLSDELTERMRTHLAACPACQELMKQMDREQASALSAHTVGHCSQLGTSVGRESETILDVRQSRSVGI